MEAVAASSYSLVVVGSIYLLTSFGDETLFPERWQIPSRQKNVALLIMKMQTWLLMIINEFREWVIALNYYSKLAYLGRRPSYHRSGIETICIASHFPRIVQCSTMVQPFYFIFSWSIFFLKRPPRRWGGFMHQKTGPGRAERMLWFVTKCKQMNWVDQWQPIIFFDSITWLYFWPIRTFIFS